MHEFYKFHFEKLCIRGEFINPRDYREDWCNSQKIKLYFLLER